MKRVVVIGILVSLTLCLAAPLFAQGIAVAPNVELHGYMQNRLYTAPDSSSRFVTERVSLSAVGKLGTDGTAYVEVYFNPWVTDAVVPNSLLTNQSVSAATGTVPLTTAEEARTYLESAYVDLPLGGGRIRVGKGRQLNFGMTPTYPNRKTTQYGILAEAFTQDRIQGIQYSFKGGTFNFGASVYSDQDVATRGIGDFAGVLPNHVIKHLTDRDIPGQVSGKLAFSSRVGMTTKSLEAHLSGAWGALSMNQLGAINSTSAFNLQTNTSTTHQKYGVDAVYSFDPFVLQGEVYTGKFSAVGITGYSLLWGYQPKTDPNSRRYYLRYAALNNDLTPNANPVTWNTEQLTVGIVQPIRKGVWAEFNWEHNMHRNLGIVNPGKPAVQGNDLAFVEFFTGF